MAPHLFAVADEPLSSAQKLIQSAIQWLTTNGLSFALSILVAILVYLVGSWLAKTIRIVILKGMSTRGMDQTFAVYLANILHGVIMTLVIITALGQLGVPTAQFSALVAAAGLAIGLALQGNLSNFASGFLLVFFRPFKRGDYVMAAGTEGAVEEIGIFTTVLNTPDNRKVVIPNSSITGANIVNFTANPRRGLSVACTVANTHAAEKVRQTLLSVAAENPNLLKDPAPSAVVTLLGDGKFTMELRASSPTAKYWDAIFSLNESIKAALEREGIGGPTATMRILKD